MPIGLGLASSHAPSTHAVDFQAWENIHVFLNSNTPQPPETATETEEVINEWIPRIKADWKTLGDKVAEYGTELLIIIGGDQTEMFDRSLVPNFMIFVGDSAWGQNNNQLAGEEPSEETLIRLKVDRQASQFLLESLVAQGFDVNASTEQVAFGRRPERGTPHAFIVPAPFLMPELNIPTILVYENTYDPPSPTAQRCYDLGKAIARAFKRDPRRIAIYGSGGMSHDPRGPRSGWIDEPLDRWFLQQIEQGEPEKLTALYKFDSMTMTAGTGELRSWITVAGAMEEMGQRRGNVVDYLPAHKSVTGLGWAWWQVEEPVAAG